ncbi:MAG TPA: class I SAM-dependent methyltransferase, partial [Turneriella sp.]|nr:class I SAM-dependent methyltransferase [Turneriella sp.]
RGITCYRVYDRDIPEYPYTADIYEDHLILTEVATASFIERADSDVIRAEIKKRFATIFHVDINKIHQKTRSKQKGGMQYQKLSEGGAIIAHGNGLQFYIYPDNWLDVGLFLDHRNLRKTVRESAADKKMLNLFCYTGSFSINAGAGGAKLVHSVDLSSRYVKVLTENWRLNADTIAASVLHETFAMDARTFLQESPQNFYDIIVCDAPVFSRSSRQTRDFDVLRDHPQLIRDALRTLSPNGILYFSTNFRKFRIRFPEEGDSAQVKNISAQTIPEDFRNKWIHTCYSVQKSAS